MLSFVAQRIVKGAIVLLAIIVLNFFLIRLAPGDPAVVMAGDDEEVLTSAIGYLRDTPPPWLPGNSALAAHRDRLFRPLERIRVGDDIWLATPYGDFQYRVRRTLVVEPTDLWVLDPLPAVSSIP